jgi:hypothetical protein
VVRVPDYRTEKYCVSCEVRSGFICYVEESKPPLWSSGQRSWQQMQRPGINSLRYQILWEVVGLERGPLSLVRTIEELLERKSSGSGRESREYGRSDSSRWSRGIIYLQHLASTSPTSAGRSVDTVRTRTQATGWTCLGMLRNTVKGLRQDTRSFGQGLNPGVLDGNIQSYEAASSPSWDVTNCYWQRWVSATENLLNLFCRWFRSITPGRKPTKPRLRCFQSFDVSFLKPDSFKMRYYCIHTLYRKFMLTEVEYSFTDVGLPLITFSTQLHVF